jgi:hypothetical protein
MRDKWEASGRSAQSWRNGAKTAKEGRGGIWDEVLSLTSSLREESKKVLEACLSV